jgi:hypothetical protein
MKTTSQKNALGGGFGINRGLKAASHLSAAVPPYANVRVSPGLGKITPGAPKSGHAKVTAKKNA